MNLASLPPSWQVTALFFLTLLPLCALMKLVAFRDAPEFKNDWALILSPFPTPVSVKRALPLSEGPRLIRRFLVALVACVGAYWLYWNVFRAYRLPPILLSYIGAIMLWLVSEALGS